MVNAAIIVSILLFVAGHLGTAIWLAGKMTAQVAALSSTLDDLRLEVRQDLDAVRREIKDLGVELQTQAKDVAKLKGTLGAS
ncbi:MAG TPA: hypothetical protein DEH78_19090 [Solibacterales bacterium]|nr:hypothetical protein [Bryobacterales bacterium]